MVLRLSKIIPLGGKHQEEASKILEPFFILSWIMGSFYYIHILSILLNDKCQYKNKSLCFSFFQKGLWRYSLNYKHLTCTQHIPPESSLLPGVENNNSKGIRGRRRRRVINIHLVLLMC